MGPKRFEVVAVVGWTDKGHPVTDRVIVEAENCEIHTGVLVFRDPWRAFALGTWHRVTEMDKAP